MPLGKHRKPEPRFEIAKFIYQRFSFRFERDTSKAPALLLPIKSAYGILYDY